MSYIDIEVDADDVLHQLDICEVIQYYSVSDILEELDDETLVECLKARGYKVTEDVGEDEE